MAADANLANVVFQTDFEGSTTTIPEQTVFFLSGDSGTSNIDQYAEYVSTNASFNGANNATTFLDDTGRTWTATGATAKLTTAATKFGSTTSAFMNATGQYWSTPYSASNDFGVGDFTVECFFNLAGASPGTDGGGNRRATLIGCSQSGTGWAIVVIGNTTVTGLSGDITIECRQGGALQQVYCTKGSAYTYGQWYHMALTRQNGVSRFFIDGVLIGSSTALTQSVTMGGQALFIGSSTMASWDGAMNGYIAHARVSKGIARYTDTFAVPTSAYPDSSVLDPKFSSTVLLMHGDGANNAVNSAFIDSSTNNFTITRAGDVTQGTFSPFPIQDGQAYTPSVNGGSAYFDGTGDYLQTTIPALSGDFTVEFWLYRPAVSTKQNFVSAAGFILYTDNVTSNVLSLWNGSSNVGQAGSLATINTWYHVAVVRSGSTTTGYINGVSVWTASGALTIPGGTVYIGAEGGSGTYLNGYISDFHVIAGYAKYTGAFTIPNAPATIHANTALLLQFTNSSIRNETGKCNLALAGNAKISTTNGRASWGGSSVYLDSASYLYAPTDTTRAFGTGNFTVEAWVYLTSYSVANASVILDTLPLGGAGAHANSIIMSINSTGYPLVFTNSAWSTAGSIQVPLNTWTHVSYQRGYAGSLQIFVNGQRALDISLTLNDTLGGLTVGAVSDNVSLTGYRLNGYIEDLRITKGVARTGYFNLPTEAWPRIGLPATDATGKTVTNTSIALSPLVKKFSYNTSMRSGSPNTSTFAVNSAVETSLVFGLDDFTIEMWVYRVSTVATSVMLLDYRPLTTNGIYIVLYSASTSASPIIFHTNNAAQITSITTPPLNAWTHVALCRKSGSTRLFINGVQEGITYADSNAYLGATGRPLFLQDAYSASNTLAYPGYVQDIVISRGVGKYASTFTPPTTAFTLPANNYATPVAALPELRSKVMRPWINPIEVSGVSKMGSKSMLFSGTSGLRVPHHSDFDPGVGNFTAEAWIYPTAYNVSNGMIISHANTGTYAGWQIYLTAAGLLYLDWGTYPTSIAGKNVTPLNRWSHVALTKLGSVISIWLNGALEAQLSTALTGDTTAEFLVGCHRLFGVSGFIGYIDGVRITKGTARYTPTAGATQDEWWNATQVCIPVSQTPVDTYGDKVICLLRGEAAVDEANGIAVTNSGGAFSTGAFKYGASSMYFNGTSSYMTVPDSAGWAFGTQDFTMEMWLYPTAILATTMGIFKQATGYLNQHMIRIYLNATSGTLGCDFTSDGSTGLGHGGGAVSVNSWTHVALVREGTALVFYINGVRGSPTTLPAGFSFYNSPAVATLGMINAPGLYFQGYIDNFRVTVGQARYSGVTVSTPGDYESLVTIPDRAGSVTTTSTGARVTGSEYKYGNASAYFNGSSYLTLSSSSAFNFGTADFTVDFWIKPTAYPPVEAELYDQINTASGSYVIGTWQLALRPTGALAVAVMTGVSAAATPITTGVSAVVLNVWQHIAVVRSNGVLTIYVDGVSKGSAAWATAMGSTTTANISRQGNTLNYYFTGYMDDFRITKAARWTAPFTPPTAESYREAAQSFIPPTAYSTSASTVSGIIKDANGDPCSRKVYVYDRATGALIGSDISNVSTGTYSAGVTSSSAFIVALDDDMAPDLNAIIVDRIVPA